MVGFHGILSMVGYLMSNPHYTYISNIIRKHILFVTFLNKLEFIFFTQSDVFKHFDLIRIIEFTINHLLAHSEVVIIIIIMSCHLHGYPWSSLATSPYHPSLLAGLQGYIPYPHIAAVCMFELVVLLLLDHMRGSIGVLHWWVRPAISH